MCIYTARVLILGGRKSMKYALMLMDLIFARVDRCEKWAKSALSRKYSRDENWCTLHLFSFLCFVFEIASICHNITFHERKSKKPPNNRKFDPFVTVTLCRKPVKFNCLSRGQIARVFFVVAKCVAAQYTKDFNAHKRQTR